jgi:protein-tyrosine phosphatase
MIDLHCHILPGVDDGAESIDVSLAMARMAASDGVQTIVATPHFFREDCSSNNFALVDERRRELSEALVRDQIAVEIKSGAEVHISHDLISEIRENRKSLVLNGSGYMFVEFPSGHIYPGVKNLFFDLMTEGIVPIIAHPERNAVLARQASLLYDLVQVGALAQANGGSIMGLYGPEARETILRFLECHLVHFLASDGHNSSSLPPRLSEAARCAESVIGKEEALCLVDRNPQAVLDDLDIPYLPQPVDPRKSKKSISVRIPEFLRRR